MRSLILKITALAVACLLVVSLLFDMVTLRQTTEQTARRTLEDSTHLLLLMRQTYRERVQQAELPLNEQTIRLCPGSTISEMAQRHQAETDNLATFANVSDNPRNPRNRADAYSQTAIEHFKAHPQEKLHFQSIRLPDGQPGYQMSAPLWIEPACLACHGPRGETLPLIQARYAEAGGFDYRNGDLRGVLYTRIENRRAEQSELIWTRLLAITVTGAVLFLTLLTAFERFQLRRLRTLAAAVEDCGEGQFPILPISARHDEVDRVIGKFNEMVEAISQRERLLSEKARHIEHQKLFLDTVLENLHDPVLVIDSNYRIVSHNRALRERCGTRFRNDRDNLCHYVIHGLASPCQEHQRRCPLKEIAAQGEIIRLTHVGTGANDQPILYDVAASPLCDLDGKVTGVIESFHDITALVQNEAELRVSREELAQQAHSDPLTGLPNRRAFEECLAESLQEAERKGNSLGLAFLDLDGFKDINDALGHPVGDELLRHVADTLRHSVRQSDFVGRLAGDEFVVIIRDLEHPQVLERIAEQIIEKRRQPVLLAGQKHIVSTSVGLACYPADARHAEELIKLADIAMYSAKKAGRNRYHFFAPAMDTEVRKRFELGHDLQQAVDEREFFLVYQPQLDADGHSLRGVEALMRWQSPTRGLVPPDEFIPLLEDTGLIRQVGAWLLDESLGQLRRWLDAGMPELVMSINVSASEFNDPELIDRITAALAKHRIPPYLLELEVTERMALLDIEHMVNLLGQLRALGIRSALDDFGTGYSSLSYLTRLPIATLKIDRSFVRTLPHSEKSQGVVHLIAGLGRLMGLEIVAEGVEHAGELEHIRAAGCEIVQGYLFGKPQSAAEVVQLQNSLQQHQNPTGKP
ncbi:EAL domain-containing protein [Dechloromonas sp. ZY10]|uniref:EAL domain-containing protein n=1 Tax=Dechloromonas aquae TaxID=2664436 RepID=UPI003529AC59